MGNVLEIKNITKTYKDFKLDDVSFNLEKGYIMGFIGENGAGKTTTIKLIMNLLKRDSGEIKIFGKDNVKYSKEIKEKIGFVYDDCFYYEKLSIKKNAKIISNFYKQWSFETFSKYLKIFGLNEDQKVKELSKGMKMKFAIAIALSHNAEFLIMDEPTAGLDPIVREELLDIFQKVIQNEDIAILISTHITSDLERISDYITYINKGKIEFSKPTIDVLEEYRIVKGDKSLLNDENRKAFISINITSFGFEALTNNVSKINAIFKDSVILEKPTLEDIMVFKSREAVGNI
ncbi:ABC transporter ATP-binding protein [Clostridium senegalense]|uniref:ABC transporter ATP-binding protein n=1 Tax=Clostridium senegalense TaxID=1465809 RepID=A0A6M0H6Y0_9CLOT|nr:ABC transporter ATP-binding protein [Clostridium senegalense]NEU06399.1 ABC transporter ATP-binding protein [Clostridium senegalense]